MKKIYAALAEDARQGWIWSDYGSTSHRRVVKILNCENGRSVYCETLRIDANFIKRYNKASTYKIKSTSDAMVMSEWYREKLGYSKQEEILRMTIGPQNGALDYFWACTDHPQVVVRVAAWLGFVSVCLGAIGVVFGAISLWVVFA